MIICETKKRKQQGCDPVTKAYGVHGRSSVPVIGRNKIRWTMKTHRWKDPEENLADGLFLN